MQFTQVVGQSMAKERLVTMFKDNKLSHAVMLCEKPGYGALPLVLSFISYMLCPNRSANDSCGSCPVCNRTGKMIHPDIHFVMPVNTTKTISSDKKPVSDTFLQEWREIIIKDPYFTEQDWYNKIGIENKVGNIGVNEANLIIKKMGLMSYEGGDKFMFVWLPEKMNQEAANKLLKFIEEPSEGTYIFMITHAPEKIIPTILSRCQIVRIPPIGLDELSGELMEEFDLSGDEATFFARISGGSLVRARELMFDTQIMQQHDIQLGSLLEGCASKDLSKVIEFWEEISATNRDNQKMFLEYALEFVRMALMLSKGLPEIANVPPSKMKQLLYWSEKLKPSFYGKAYDILNQALEDVSRNVNSKYIFADLGNRFFLSL
ncbi:MAG: ATP-binding protein [Bacteroidales bacterium]